MTSRTLRFGAAVLASVALVACNKPADKPVTDSTGAASATPSVGTPTDSSIKIDSTAPKATVDSAKPKVDSAKPAAAPVKK
jgi:hypothetical protein